MVENEGQLVGLLTAEHLGDWVLLHTAMNR